MSKIITQQISVKSENISIKPDGVYIEATILLKINEQEGLINLNAMDSFEVVETSLEYLRSTLQK